MSDPTAPVDELRAKKLRKLFAELEALDPAEAERIATKHHAALTAEAGLRVWQCPICFVKQVSRAQPDGWLICEPFTRVAACAVCRPHISFGTAG